MNRVISVNVGTPVEIGTSRNKPVLSAIVKVPFRGSVAVRKLNLDGDRQADLSVHGGENKAVYVYPSEHYAYWKDKYPGMKMGWGTFGENLTTKGLLENEVHIGDQFDIGSARFEVTQPRFPCYKLGMRFNDDAMVEAFLDSERTGFYLKVLREGRVQADDAITLVRSQENSETITSIVREVKKGN
jgi:MOSC domain-containing protein YiiM